MKLSIITFILFVLITGSFLKTQAQVSINAVKGVTTNNPTRTHSIVNKNGFYRWIWGRKYKTTQGFNVIYDTDGILHFKGTFSTCNDTVLIRNGKFEYYHFNGQLRDAGAYLNNKRVGIWKHYNKNGDLVFKQDHATLTRTYLNTKGDTLAIGKMEFKENNFKYHFFNLASHKGQWLFYDENGICRCQGDLSGGLKHGKWTYYKNSNKKVSTKKYRWYHANYNFKFLEACEWK